MGTHELLARTIGSPEAAARVLEAASRLVRDFGDPVEWQSAESLELRELAAEARRLHERFSANDAKFWAARLGLPAGTVPALQSLLIDVAGAALAVRGATVAVDRRFTVPPGIRAWFALVVEMLEAEGVPRSSGVRSRMVRGVEAITQALDVTTTASVRPYLRGPDGSVRLMSPELARTFLVKRQPFMEKRYPHGTG